MKQDIFNFRRFGKYFASDIRTCVANYGLSLVTMSAFVLLTVYALGVAIGLIFNGEWNGLGFIPRFLFFGIVMFCIVVTMPVRCYGRLTQKQYGSFWLTLPASKLEKFLSMIVITCIIAPLAGTAVYLLMDSLLCLLDPTCGTSIVAFIGQLSEMAKEFIGDTAGYVDQLDAMANTAVASGAAVDSQYESLFEFIDKMTSPWLYIDDIFMVPLTFLLGALVFKKSKIAKTFLSLIAISIVFSIVFSTLGMDWAMSFVGVGQMTSEGLDGLLESGIIKHAVLYEILSDLVVNVALLAAVFFRIKTLKH